MKRTLLVLGITALGWMAYLHLRANASGFTSDPAEIKKIDLRAAQEKKSAREISIRQANLFHKRFIDTCMEKLPREIEVQYVGLLGTDNGRQKLRIHSDDVGNVLSWHVQNHLVIFDIWLTTMPTEQTLARYMIENMMIYVNVTSVDQGRSVDAKLPELGGQSVRDVLKLLENEKPAANKTNEG